MRGAVAVIVKPHVDWFALSPTLALLATTGLLLMVAVFTRRTTRKAAAAFVAFAGFVDRVRARGRRRREEPGGGRRRCTTRCSATAGPRSPRC